MLVAQRELTERLFWLCRLRWLAVLGIIGLTLGAVYLLHFPLPLPLLVSTGLIVAAYNALFIATTRLARGPDGAVPIGLAQILAHLQIGVDLVALTGVIHFTGGAESPLGVFLVFHMIIASTLLPPGAAFFQATVASVLYGAMILLEAIGALHHYAVGFAPPYFHASPQVVWPTLALLSALYVSIFLATSIVQRLRRRERELSELTERLEHEQTRTQVAYEQTQAAQLMQTRYMHRVSHELRRPLSAAASLLKVLLDGYGDKPADEQTEQMLRRAVNRMQQALDLVVDLLALSQAREAPLREPRVWTDLSRLVEQVQDEQAEAARQAQVTLSLDLEDHLGPVWAQPEGLATVIRNLTSNALKYTPAGGQVVVAARQDEHATYLSVSDTGIGIPEEDLPRVFEEFFRSREARERDPGGTGLGLAIVKSIVEAHGGEIKALRRPEGGTTFEVILPHRYPETEE
jgi:signal transduction histidine kinase